MPWRLSGERVGHELHKHCVCWHSRCYGRDSGDKRLGRHGEHQRWGCAVGLDMDSAVRRGFSVSRLELLEINVRGHPRVKLLPPLFRTPGKDVPSFFGLYIKQLFKDRRKMELDAEKTERLEAEFNRPIERRAKETAKDEEHRSVEEEDVLVDAGFDDPEGAQQEEDEHRAKAEAPADEGEGEGAIE